MLTFLRGVHCPLNVAESSLLDRVGARTDHTYIDLSNYSNSLFELEIKFTIQYYEHYHET